MKMINTSNKILTYLEIRDEQNDFFRYPDNAAKIIINFERFLTWIKSEEFSLFKFCIFKLFKIIGSFNYTILIN